jgi:PAS domain S-box-containing protein
MNKSKQNPRKEKTKEAITNIKKEIAKSEGILSAIGDGVSIQNTNYVIVYQNKIHKKTFGNHIGEYCYKAYRLKESVCEKCPIAATFKDGRIHMLQREIQTDKEIKYFEIIASPLKDSKGNILAGLELVRDITDRKLAEKALHESETHLRAIIEDQTELICRFKPDGTLTFVNGAYCRYFDKKRDQLIGKSFLPLIPEEDRAAVLQRITSLSRENPIMSHEHPVLMPNGEVGWQQWTNHALYDELGNLVEYQSVGRDITERKHIEDALRSSEEKFRQLFDQAGDLIAILDFQGKFIDINQKFEEESGWTSEEIIGRNVLTSGIVTEESVKNISLYLNQMIQGKEIPVFEIEGIRKDGKIVPYEIRATHIKKNDTPVAIQAILRNITDRKKAEQQLAIFKKFAEGSSLAYGFADLNGDIIYINTTLCRILGEEKPEDALGKNVEIYYPDNMKSKLLNKVLPTVKSKGGWTGEIPLQSIRGKVTSTIQNISLIYDDKGKPLYIGNIITDITERRKTEAEIQKRVKELEEFYDMAVGRELRMKELKEEIKEIKKELEEYKKG